MGKVDYQLTIHYNTVEDCHNMKPNGYIMKFNTDKAIAMIKIRFGFEVEKEKMYKTENKELFKVIHDFLEQKENHLVGILGDDSWPLYANLNKEYWASIYGENYIEEHGPYGSEYYKDIEDLH